MEYFEKLLARPMGGNDGDECEKCEFESAVMGMLFTGATVKFLPVLNPDESITDFVVHIERNGRFSLNDGNAVEVYGVGKTIGHALGNAVKNFEELQYEETNDTRRERNIEILIEKVRHDILSEIKTLKE